MKMLEWIKKGTAEMVEGLKWPFRVKMIDRALESLIDGAEVARDRVECQLVEKRKALTTVTNEDEAKAVLKAILTLKAELAAAVEAAGYAAEEKTYLNSPAPKEEK